MSQDGFRFHYDVIVGFLIDPRICEFCVMRPQMGFQNCESKLETSVCNLG